MQNPGLKNWLLLILLGLIWGGSFLAVSYALEGFGPITIAAVRIAIGAVIVTAASILLGHGLPSFVTAEGRRTWVFALGMALFTNAIPFSLLSWAQQHVSSGYAGITMAMGPLFVLPLSHYLVPGHRLTPVKTFGFFVGFAGVVILIGPAQILQSGGSDIENIARLAAVGASACYAIGSIITRLSPQGPQLAFGAAALMLASVILLPVALVVEGVPAMPEPRALLGLLYLGVVPTALATVILVFVIKSAGPAFMSLVNYQVPVWAVIFGMVFLGESLPASFLWALGLILAGLAISQARLARFRL